MKVKTGFIGLGVMGFPMAGHLVSAGYPVRVFNRSPNKRVRWLEAYQGEFAEHCDELARNLDIVFCCVGNDDDLYEVTLGKRGAFQSMKPGSVFVDHTTASASLAKELAAEAQERGFAFLDAPVSGGQSGAENGQLTIMVGGNRVAYEKVEPILACYARSSRLLGESGSGQLCKMVNQICVAGVIQGLAEGLLFGQKAGLNMAAVIDVISKGAAQSWQMENRASTMLAGSYDFGFAVDWMRKDLGMIFTEAELLAIDLPVTRQIDDFYADIQAMGGGRWDTSSLLSRLTEKGEI